MAKTIVTAELVRQLLDYDPETGIFTRKVRLAQRHQAGDRADFLVTKGKQKGYRRVALKSQRFLAHRLAWLYVHGSWPMEQIDHINQDKGDNRICNLREADNSLNQQNIDQAQVNSVSGLRGANLHMGGKCFRVKVGFQKKYYHIGLYADKEKAHRIYVMAKQLLQSGLPYAQVKNLVRAQDSP